MNYPLKFRADAKVGTRPAWADGRRCRAGNPVLRINPAAKGRVNNHRHARASLHTMRCPAELMRAQSTPLAPSPMRDRRTVDDLWYQQAHSGSGSSGLTATDQAEPAQSVASRGAARRQSTPEGIGINPTLYDATASDRGEVLLICDTH
jgi:hypothetical protein